MTKRFIGKLPDQVWQAVLRHYLGEADAFRVHMPNGESDFSVGRAEFEALPGVVVGDWDGMRDAVEIMGPLSPESEALFTSMETSLERYSVRKLWDYQLLARSRELLYIGDFNDLVLDEPDPEVLRRLGIHLDNDKDRPAMSVPPRLMGDWHLRQRTLDE